MTRSVSFLTAVFLILFIALVSWCMYHHAPLIEADIMANSSEALSEAGMEGAVSVAVDGLDVFLSGQVDDEAARQRAVASVQAVTGVRAVHDQLEVTSSLPAYTGRPQFSATFDGRSVVLSGVVSDSTTRASLVGAARYAFNDKQVIDQLQILASVPATWAPLLRTALTQLATFQSGKIQLMGQRLTVSGTVAENQSKDNAAAAISSALPGEDDWSFRMDVATLQADVEQIVSCQANFDTLLAAQVIGFNTGSAVILIDSHPLLDDLAELVSRCSGVRIEVQGHTDSAGDAADNMRLSELRARAVVKYLTDEGVDTSQLIATGYGEDKPIAANDTPAGRARNRRIEFVTLGN